MDTKKLLSVVHGLEDSSWHICDVDLNTKEETVCVTLQYATPLQFHCKKCGRTEYTHIHDHKTRTWRHKDLCEFMTVLKADVPRVSCVQCGCVSQVTIPWAQIFMRITHSLAQQILDACMVMSLSDVQKTYRMEQGNGILKHTKYLWLKNKENLSVCQQQTFNELKNSDVKAARAYALKELFSHFWHNCTTGWAAQFVDKWYRTAIHSGSAPVKRVAYMLKKYWYGIINYINYPVTNARSEGINSKIPVYTKRAYCYKSVTMLKNIIFLACGGLHIHPLKSR